MKAEKNGVASAQSGRLGRVPVFVFVRLICLFLRCLWCSSEKAGLKGELKVGFDPFFRSSAPDCRDGVLVLLQTALLVRLPAPSQTGLSSEASSPDTRSALRRLRSGHLSKPGIFRGRNGSGIAWYIGSGTEDHRRAAIHISSFPRVCASGSN